MSYHFSVPCPYKILLVFDQLTRLALICYCYRLFCILYMHCDLGIYGTPGTHNFPNRCNFRLRAGIEVTFIIKFDRTRFIMYFRSCGCMHSPFSLYFSLLMLDLFSLSVCNSSFQNSLCSYHFWNQCLSFIADSNLLQ